MKTILLTGSEGYIGTALHSHLLSTNQYLVKCVDKCLGIDIFDIQDLYDIDAVIHLAANSSVYCNDFEKIERNNVRAFEYLVSLSNKFDVPLIYASSAFAYEKNITSSYGESKKANEIYANIYHPNKSFGLRIHNVYSLNPRPDTLFHALLNSELVKLINKGLVYRHFTYLPDVLESIVYILNDINKIRPGVYNILNPVENTILDLALEVKKHRPELELKLIEGDGNTNSIYQYIDESVPQLPLNYRSIEEGVHDIFCTHLLDETDLR